MKLIDLGDGIYTKVDDIDYDRVMAFGAIHEWHPTLLRSGLYVQAHWQDEDGWHRVYLHRFILGLTDPKILGDHKNHDTLDNRRENLRPATISQNHANSKKTWKSGGPSSSRFRGVSKNRKKWRAYIRVDGEKFDLGGFDREEDAAKEYDKAALTYFGEFASLNFPV